jgi:hypothetical protein
MGEHVKGRLEGVLEPSGPFRQSADLAEFPREEGNYQARLAEIRDAKN